MKNSISILAFLTILLPIQLIFAQTLPTTNQNAPSLTNLRVDQTPYDPYNSENKPLILSVDFSNFPTESSVNVSISKDSVLVQNWSDQLAGSGTKSFNWDGHSGNPYQYKGFAADGEYLFSVNAAYPIPNQRPGESLQQLTQILPVQKIFVVQSNNNTQNDSYCEKYPDVATNDKSCDALRWLKENSIMTRNIDGTFGINSELQRQQSVKVILKTFHLFDEKTDYCRGTDPFPDSPIGLWSSQYICAAKEISVNGSPMITGYKDAENKGLFLPGNSVSRIEFLALIFRNLTNEKPATNIQHYSDTLPEQWYSGYALLAKQYGLFDSANLKPELPITRREVADILYKLHLLGKI